MSVSYSPLAKICFTPLGQAIEKQHKEDQKVSDLVDQMNEILKFAQHSQELKSDDVYSEKVFIELLRQTTECAIFICQHFKGFFTSMSSIYYYI